MIVESGTTIKQLFLPAQASFTYVVAVEGSTRVNGSGVISTFPYFTIDNNGSVFVDTVTIFPFSWSWTALNNWTVGSN